MKKVIWKSNIRIKAEDHGSIVVAVEDSAYLLRRKRGTEIPAMKAKNIVQLKKTGSKSKKKK
jgi:hypothetical protein|tara:strand:+ start:546 stop:731 length:186 start_codon:yes stop_codon:yes gene_type:complete